MRGRSAVAAGLAVILAVGLLYLAQGGGAASSALSADARGWLLARQYLEARGVEVKVRAKPLERPAGVLAGDTVPPEGSPDAPDAVFPDVLVLAFPWQRPALRDELRAIDDHLRAGGQLLVAYSREISQPREEDVLASLDLYPEEVRPEAPLVPWDWWSYQREDWTLTPGESWREALKAAGSAPPADLAVRAFRQAPLPPEGAEILYRGGPESRPLVFTYGRLGSRVAVLPADLLANGHLLQAGNADLLEMLRRELGETWTFSEYHHGLTSPELARSTASGAAWDLFLLHLGLLYVLAIWALSRPFGPVWSERLPSAGSAASFLRNLGSLHHELGHHREAARLLVDRAVELEPSLADGPVEELRAESAKVAGDGGLVEVARRLARLRGGGAAKRWV